MNDSLGKVPAGDQDGGPVRMSRQELRSSLWLASLYAIRMLGLFLVLPVFALHARQLPGVQREHRQDQEQPQHANGVQTGQPEAGSQFLARHAHRPAVLIAGRHLTEGIVHADMGNRVVVATTMVSVARRRPGKAHAAPLPRRPMRRHRGAIPGRSPPHDLIVQRTGTADQHPPCRAPYNGSPARPPDQLGIVSGSPHYGIRRTPIPTA